MPNENLVAVIPAFQAEPSIASVVAGTTPIISRVVVVDDGSTDRTGLRARDAGALVLRHDGNRGKGAALRTGFKWALEHGADAVVTLDADGQHLPSEIPRLITAWQKGKADLVIGSRAHLFDGMVRRRRLANQFSARTISRVSKLHVDDSQSGFRLYTAGLLRALRIEGTGFEAESEVIVKAGLAGMRVVTVPIELGFVDGLVTSHYRPVEDTVRIAVRVFQTRFGSGK